MLFLIYKNGMYIWEMGSAVWQACGEDRTGGVIENFDSLEKYAVLFA
jgi:hypothetical protein